MRLTRYLDFRFRKRLPAEFGGASIWLTPRADSRILRRGWNGIAYDLQLVARNIVTRDMVVWDLGANQGVFAFMAAARSGARGQVFALEADPRYADLVFRSSRGLKPGYAGVEVLCAAISDGPGIVRFASSASGHARNKLESEITDDEVSAFEATKPVVALTGDALLDVWAAPALVKLDVEGAELRALHGASRLLNEVRPVFYIEVSKQNVPEVSALFHAANYDLFHLKGDGSEAPVEQCTFYTIARPRP